MMEIPWHPMAWALPSLGQAYNLQLLAIGTAMDSKIFQDSRSFEKGKMEKGVKHCEASAARSCSGRLWTTMFLQLIVRLCCFLRLAPAPNMGLLSSDPKGWLEQTESSQA